MIDENDTAEAVVTDDAPEATPEVTPEATDEQTEAPKQPNLCGGCANWNDGKCFHFIHLVEALGTDDFQFAEDFCPEYEATPSPDTSKE